MRQLLSGTAIRDFIENNPWVHTAIGLFGNASFFVGSVFFLFESLQRAGVWLFIAGSAGMLIDRVGSAVARAASES